MLGQTVIYDGGAYTVVSEENGRCDIVSESHVDLYNAAGLNVSDGLKTFNTPEGATVIADEDGAGVGFADIASEDLVPFAD
jgi:hypothetical protein